MIRKAGKMWLLVTFVVITAEFTHKFRDQIRLEQCSGQIRAQYIKTNVGYVANVAHLGFRPATKNFLGGYYILDTPITNSKLDILKSACCMNNIVLLRWNIYIKRNFF